MSSSSNGLSGKKNEIIEVSKRLFLRNGYDATSVSMILMELGMAKGTLYHHFKSKEDILLAVINDIIDMEKNKTLQEIDSRRFRNLNPCEKLLTLINNADISSENSQLINALHSKNNANMQARMLGNYIEKFCPIYADVISQGNDDGSFNTDFPLESAELIVGGFQFLTDTGFHDWDEKTINRRTNAMLSIIENILGVKKGNLVLSNSSKIYT